MHFGASRFLNERHRLYSNLCCSRYPTQWSFKSVTGDSSGAPHEPSQEEADERHFDEYLAGLNAALVIEPKPTIALQPGKTSFDHPAPRLDLEALNIEVAPDNLKIPAAIVRAPLSQFPTRMRLICPNYHQLRDEWLQSRERPSGFRTFIWRDAD